MAAAKLDPAVLAHLEWLGFVRPTGLVVSAPALVRAGAILNRQDSDGQRLLRQSLVGAPDAKDVARERSDLYDTGPEDEPRLRDFRGFARDVLGWKFSPRGYAGVDATPIPPELEVALPEYGETLRPDLAVRELDPQDGSSDWQLLVTVLEPGEDLDRVVHRSGGLEASPHGRMERLLRQTGVPAGLICNHDVVRLISAPRGESSGWLDFRVPDMVQTAGRPIATALRLLLSETRLLSLPRSQRLAALLENSRRFQNEVSERLAEQVLHALYDLLRGFQAADDASKGELLRKQLEEHPDEIYRALLTVILRLVFLLYAEERDMLSEDETFVRFYSIAGLYERLRQDAALYPDTMDQRFGAWAQLLVLFRMVHDGAEAGQLRLPARRGVLFDPDRYAFLEGRSDVASDFEGTSEPPLVPDGTIFRVLEQLLVLDGERISYRALDVEQIGSIYETMMGFRLEVATGQSVAIRAQKRQGAPTCIDLDALLDVPSKKRAKWIADATDRKISVGVKSGVETSSGIGDLHAALYPVIDTAATPDLVPRSAMLLQPSEERRRSGSHYTPRALTEPIVRTTLEPILAQLRGPSGEFPTPDQILDLKVCDPAMGSGAFLVEACRQLGDVLVAAWHAHDALPELPPDEDEIIFARRLIAQRCLYGVDRNPVAVDLAKVSLWLVTLAREHALTFVDHALRRGDSLVALSRAQLIRFHWDPKATVTQSGLEAMEIQEQLERVNRLRAEIRNAPEDVPEARLRELWDEAQSELRTVRLYGDLAVSAFFEGDKPANREARRNGYAAMVLGGLAEDRLDVLDTWRRAEPPLAPFHWELEFPEVFFRDAPGFDAIVGNPPFAGKNTLQAGSIDGYHDWLLSVFPESHGNADLAAFFFRAAYSLLRDGGVFGLVATNTIGQGDTRTTGLSWICTNGGNIFSATRRLTWPGLAAVVVSVVHVIKGNCISAARLDGKNVDKITAFLHHRGPNFNPSRLLENSGQSFVGSYVLGMGFTFDDTRPDTPASTIADMQTLIADNPKNAELIFPYIGGEEVNSSPSHQHHRFVIDFYDRSLEEAASWPDLLDIVYERVKPERDLQKRKALRERWWQYAEKRPGLQAAIAGKECVIGVSIISQYLTFATLPTGPVFASSLIIFPFDSMAALCGLQSRVHEVWARFFGSSMRNDLRYTPSDCFETFPFPQDWHSDSRLESAGRRYRDYRAMLMIRGSQGLTKTYTRFHDPSEGSPDIAELRRLHGAMDRAVLDAYGWSDISSECAFIRELGDGPGESTSPYRYRWPDEVREEVLARLLELNEERALAEARTPKSGSKGRKKTAPPSSGAQLFELDDLN